MAPTDMYQLGIDFGTSTTKVAVRQSGAPGVLPIGSDGVTDWMPSVAAYGRTRTGFELLSVGEDAAATPSTQDHISVAEVKRALALTEHHQRSANDALSWLAADGHSVDIFGTTVSPVDVISDILHEVLRRVEAAAPLQGVHLGGTSVRDLPIRLGCPVTAGIQMRKSLIQAADRVGLTHFEIADLLEEPVLASLAYVNLELDPGQTVLVYDFGGGSFDVAIVRVSVDPASGRRLFHVLGTDGEPFCGGKDVDTGLAREIARRAGAQLEQLHPSVQQELRRLAQRAKEALSREENVQIPLPLSRSVGWTSDIVQISRSQFDAILDSITIDVEWWKSGGKHHRTLPIINATLECTLRAWRRAHDFESFA